MAYVNDVHVAGKSFCHYIAELKWQELSETLARVKFFTFLLDGSTSSGNVDNKLDMAVYYGNQW